MQLIGFIGYFVVYVRLMNLFREKHLVDLKYYFESYDLVTIILFVFMLYWVRRNLFFFVKVHWYRLHYFFMHRRLDANYLHPYYNNFFREYFLYYVFKVFPELKYINRVISGLMLLILITESFNNNFVLDYSLLVLPWYRLCKFIHGIMYYFEYKYHMAFEYYLCNDTYDFIATRNGKNTEVTDIDFTYYNCNSKTFRLFSEYKLKVILN